MRCYSCRVQLRDQQFIGKGGSGATKTWGREWSLCKQRFQGSAKWRVTFELVIEEGRKAITEGTHSISKVPLGGGAADKLC